MSRRDRFFYFILSYKIFSFFFGGLFYRLSDINKAIYLTIDIILLAVIVLVFQKTISRNALLWLSVIMLIFFLNFILADNATFKGLVTMLLLYTSTYLFILIFKFLPLKKFFKAFYIVGGINIFLGMIELMSQGKFNIFINYYTLAQKIEAINKSGTDLAVFRGGFEHPLVTAIMLSVTLPFYFRIKNIMVRYSCILLQMYLIFGTEKRTGMFCSILLIVIYCMMQLLYIDRNKGRFRTSLYFLVAASILFLISNYVTISNQTLIEIFFTKFDALDSTDSFSKVHRLTSISKSLDIIFNQNILRIVFGNGFTFLPMYMASRGINITTLNFLVIDNSYISLLADFGLLGLGALIFYVILSSANLVKMVKRATSVKESKEIILIVLCSFWGMLAMAFLFDILNWYQGIWLISIEIAMIETIRRNRNEFKN